MRTERTGHLKIPRSLPVIEPETRSINAEIKNDRKETLMWRGQGQTHLHYYYYLPPDVLYCITVYTGIKRSAYLPGITGIRANAHNVRKFPMFSVTCRI